MHSKFIEYLMFLRDKLRSMDSVHANRLRNRVDSMVVQLDKHIQDVKSLMAKYGISDLPNNYDECEKFLEKYPDLHQEHNKMSKLAAIVSRLMINNPWLWEPGRDVGLYYDTTALKYRMMKIVDGETDYMAGLHKQLEDLDNKIAATKVPNQDLENEKNYLVGLLMDEIETIGDRLNTEWWNAIPRIIKEKCHKNMDDLMVELLASDDNIARYIKNYKSLNSIFVSPLVLKMIETRINDKISNIAPPVNFVFMFSQQDGFAGGIDMETGDICFNLQYMGKNVNGFVDTLKHEVFGHHLDEHCPNFGLRGQEMIDFVDGSFHAVNGKIVSHTLNSEECIIAISPLLKQSYFVPDITKGAIKKLHDAGWRFMQVEYQDCDSVYNYKNMMHEKNAWLIGKTKNVVRKIEKYRRCHGLPYIEKMH